MRQKRAKSYRKLMALYSLSFGFRQPYQTLVDSNFCIESTQHKIDIEKQLGVVLQGGCKPMITQCCIVELYKMGKTFQETVDLAKRFERRKCNHREAIPSDECILSVVGDKNKHRYVIATQSVELRNKLREIPAVPVIHINRTVMVLEPPSQATLDAKSEAESAALGPTPAESARVAATNPDPLPKKKRKGPKGPNPLSVKKKKPKVPSGSTNVTSRSERTELTVDARVESEGVQAAGMKRKRHEEGSNETGHRGNVTLDVPVAADEGGNAEVGNHGHKRKRRRKSKHDGD